MSFRSAALSEPTVARFVKLRLSGPHPPSKEDDQVLITNDKSTVLV